MRSTLWARSVGFFVQSVACATMPWICFVHIRHGDVDLLQKDLVFGMMMAEDLAQLLERLRTQGSYSCTVEKPAASGVCPGSAGFPSQCQNRRRNLGRSQIQ